MTNLYLKIFPCICILIISNPIFSKIYYHATCSVNKPSIIERGGLDPQFGGSTFNKFGASYGNEIAVKLSKGYVHLCITLECFRFYAESIETGWTLDGVPGENACEPIYIIATLDEKDEANLETDPEDGRAVKTKNLVPMSKLRFITKDEFLKLFEESKPQKRSFQDFDPNTINKDVRKKCPR